MCRVDTKAQGLTVVELGDAWLPAVLAVPPRGYRETYLALADERFDDAALDGELAKRDRYLELYGIVPTLEVVRRRLADDSRHRCHEAIDDTALGAAPLRIIEEPALIALSRIARARETPNTVDLGYIATVRTVQAHLTCEGLFASPLLEGTYTSVTREAVQTFQRSVMIPPSGVLEGFTLAALAQGSRERDFVLALRVLRARVIAATGLVEDGTAGPGRRTVLGRVLDAEPTWIVRGHVPLADAAPDLVSAATEAAARALGWRDAASVLAFLGRDTERVVALPLPAAPAYHGPRMQLEIEIDRGDIARDPESPWKDAGRRPALIVYTRTRSKRIALARWPTTIGGWRDRQAGGDVVEGWKESPAGSFLWRELFVTPRWIPPATTPDAELVRLAGDTYVLAREQFGPSYRSAFGLAAFVHSGARGDEGIRTHGTGSVASLARGVSHGCHRLLGVHAIWLADFVLAHRAYVERGDAPTRYRRVVRFGGTFPIAIDTLGYRVELVPPVRVEVLPGRARE